MGIHFTKKDFEVTTYRGSGPGGQHRNKTDSGVRIKHIESGLAVECCEGRSQYKNKSTAFHRLAKLLVAHYEPKVEKERYQAGHQVVRTYNFATDLMTDHQTGEKYSMKSTFLKTNGMASVLKARAEVLAKQRMAENG